MKQRVGIIKPEMYMRMLPHVHGLPCAVPRSALLFYRKPPYRLTLGGITVAYSRETSPESLGLFFVRQESTDEKRF